MFQIILVSSSVGDRDDSLFLSMDEGTTFQKQLIPFSVETLIFHPREEDKLLAYSKEGKVSGHGAGAGHWVMLSVVGTRKPWAGWQEPGAGGAGPHHRLLPEAHGVWLPAVGSTRRVAAEQMEEGGALTGMSGGLCT